MRRAIVFIYALFYSFISSGAPALLHYCGHEKNIHLSFSHQQAQNKADCCHSHLLNCEVKSYDTAAELNSEDCCVHSEAVLDRCFFNQAKYHLLGSSYLLKTKKTFVSSKKNESILTNGLVFNNGPPLFLQFHKIIVYS